MVSFSVKLVYILHNKVRFFLHTRSKKLTYVNMQIQEVFQTH